MAEPNSCTNHNPELSKAKSNRYKAILKWILKAILVIWRLYGLINKGLEFLKEHLD